VVVPDLIKFFPGLQDALLDQVNILTSVTIVSV